MNAVEVLIRRGISDPVLQKRIFRNGMRTVFKNRRIFDEDKSSAITVEELERKVSSSVCEILRKNDFMGLEEGKIPKELLDDILIASARRFQESFLFGERIEWARTIYEGVDLVKYFNEVLECNRKYDAFRVISAFSTYKPDKYISEME